MTESNDPDQIRADIERTRAELSHNVDTLGDTVNPRNIASRQVDKVKDKARTVRDAIMGSPDDPYDHGRAGDLQDGARAVGDAVSSAPSLAKQKTRGNPLAAGLIAFGAGLLVSSLIPASRHEQRAVSTLQDNLEPLKQQVTDIAHEVADNLREPAQQAAESIKTVAADGAENVQAQAKSATDEVSQQAQQSKDAVQDAQSS
ncbi:DUF3618 domain-containing protein [Micropruina sonneratiae]|uniref:DUF3618 domain-containing protein n=1 Tax=Micropruina sonneratiae TaxID=2986940 RepID=UPI002227D753|nr:DUF3618 domain-containing protein [Micropruina sp. KQZ13P-5]MCW3158610.1 DUF3618 domain-containing protein [Micropruina sp. KQZ13P-5]